MEAARAKVDGYVLDWILSQPLPRQWFFEQRNGNCRLMAPFAARLAETTAAWARAVAPVAEWVTQQLWATTRKRTKSAQPPTRLTQANKRDSRNTPAGSTIGLSAPQNLCRGCGNAIGPESRHCANCAVVSATQRLANVARLGREVARSPDARAKHSASRRRHAAACSAWNPSSQPPWLTEDFFRKNIQPRLSSASSVSIRNGLGVSHWYASQIRQGYTPHPRHWQALALVVGISADS